MASSENIKLVKRNFTIANGYFYTLDDDQDNLLQKTDDGNTAFSYPCDNLLSTTINCLTYDGVYFWSMETPSTSSVTIKRWKIDNYVFKLQQTYLLTSGTNYYSSSTFAVEHYHSTLASGVTTGDKTIHISSSTPNYGDHYSLAFAKSTSSKYRVFTNTTTDSGTTWLEPYLAFSTSAQGTYDSVSLSDMSVIYDTNNSLYKMWYSGSDGTNSRILYCNSSDSTSWSGFQLAINKGNHGTADITHAYQPCVVYDSDASLYKMWYTGYSGTVYRNIYTESSDGIGWSGTQLTTGLSSNPLYPCVIRENTSSYKMWYSTTASGICYATSTDGITWSNYGQVLTSNIQGTYDKTSVSNPAVILDGTTYKMWYTGYDGTKYRSMHAISSDGTTWSDISLCTNTTLMGACSKSIYSPVVVKNSNNYNLWFIGNGEGLTIHLGPNSDGLEENVEVKTYSGNAIALVSGTKYSYSSSTNAQWYTNIWLFNNYNTQASTGALYKLDGYDGSILTKYASSVYSSVNSSSFSNINSFTSYPNTDMLMFIRGTNTLFVNVSSENDSGGLNFYGSMVMGNIQSDLATIISTYGMCISNGNLYRLQKTPDNDNSTWTNYSYLLSPLSSFITSISIAASPAIIAANNVSTSNISAVVRDQFLQPIIGRTVTITAANGGTTSSLTTPESGATTNSNGITYRTYKAGTIAGEVTITAVASQT